MTYVIKFREGMGTRLGSLTPPLVLSAVQYQSADTSQTATPSRADDGTAWTHHTTASQW